MMTSWMDRCSEWGTTVLSALKQRMPGGQAPAVRSPFVLADAPPARSPWEGKIIIACPNEWDSMVIGLVTGTLPRSHDVLLVEDFIRGTCRVVFSPRVEYSPAALERLARLNPYERYNALVDPMFAVRPDKRKSGEESLRVDEYFARVERGLATLQKDPA